MTDKDIIEQCSEIVMNFDKKLNDEGVHFNVFSILGVASKEVKLHSKFIAELLNSNGKHALGNFFLKTFISELKKNEHVQLQDFQFDSNKYDISTEKYIGMINAKVTEGGSLDICITDTKRNMIIIENKIFAGDQKNQLLRYNNYIKQEKKNGILIYLTLDGRSSNESVEHVALSYEITIVNWLNQSIHALKNDPNISQKKSNKIITTILQYVDIIRNNLIPSNQNDMTLKMEDLFISNQNILSSMNRIIKTYDNLLENSYNTYKEELSKLDGIHNLTFSHNDFRFVFEIGFDSEEFYFGFKLEHSNNNNKFKKNVMKQLKDCLTVDDDNIKINDDFQIYSHGSDDVYLNKDFKRSIDDGNLAIVYKLIDKKKRDKFINKELLPQITDLKTLISTAMVNISV